MASSSRNPRSVSRYISNPGYAIAGGYVYYMFEAPRVHRELEAELRVIETFLERWNANDPVRATYHPSTLANHHREGFTHRLLWPLDPTNHWSQRYPEQGNHITVQLCTEKDWNKNPQVGSVAVHVFAREGNPANGYYGFQIGIIGQKRVFEGNVQRTAIQAAQMRYFGQLSGGRLSQ
ncbi:hypothetical protein FB107DRAFT_208784 [Schizophyllum commune]